MLGGYISLLDMVDGAGAGASGSEFQGGPISGLLNRIGVKPHGYRDRQAGNQVASIAPSPRPAVNPPMAVTPIPEPRVNPDYGFSGVSGVNPVTAYNEAARFGLLGPEPVAMDYTPLPMSVAGLLDPELTRQYYIDRFGDTPLADTAFRTYLTPENYR